MNLLEYQAKRLLGRFAVATPIGQVAASESEAFEAARRLGCDRFAVKAQVPVIARGRLDGVAFASSPEQVRAQARLMIGRSLTGESRLPAPVVQQVLVEERVENVREMYVAVVLDRSAGKLVLLASPIGGEGIEERAAAEPGLIRRLDLRLQNNKAVADFSSLANAIADTSALATGLTNLFRDLADAAVAYDATLIEINPLALTKDGRLVALDVKMTVDDSALYRRPELAALRQENDRIASTQTELEAQRFQINYVPLDGDIGTVVNGAGLALATYDLIVDAGGRPANFMDVRTTATSLDIAHGFGLLLTNANVRSIFVNVHGGGMQRCDTIAEGIGIAFRRHPRQVPLVICMAGNNADFARTILENNGTRYVAFSDMAEAAAEAVALSRRKAA
jgi:succinyl-CoA synthetase beta subunit